MSLSPLAANYREVAETIRAEAHGRAVRLIAVSKGQSVDSIEALFRLGHRDFGENYVQELAEKAAELERRECKGIRWHFIGHLQTNKVKALVEIEGLAAVHTVDSLKLAAELAKRWRPHLGAGKLPVFLEVNIDQEPSKTGVSPDALAGLASEVRLLAELSFQGLMCIPRAGGGEGEAFARLRLLEADCRRFGSAGQLSMGMSQDFAAAVREGATQVRVGTRIFGVR